MTGRRAAPFVLGVLLVGAIHLLQLICLPCPATAVRVAAEHCEHDGGADDGACDHRDATRLRAARAAVSGVVERAAAFVAPVFAPAAVVAHVDARTAPLPVERRSVTVLHASFTPLRC